MIAIKPDYYGDSCCTEVWKDDSYVGIFCSKSKRMVVDGEIIGFCEDIDDAVKTTVEFLKGETR